MKKTHQSSKTTHLKQIWDTIVPKSQKQTSSAQKQYISQKLMLEWLNRVLAQEEKLALLTVNNINIQEQLEKYMKETHQLNYGQVSNVKWSYEEAVEFYQLVLRKIRKVNQEEEQRDKQEQQNQMNNIVQENKITSKIMNNESSISKKSKVDKSPSHTKNNKSQLNQSLQLNKSNQINNKSQIKSPQKTPKKIQKQLEQQQEQKFLYPSNKDKQQFKNEQQQQNSKQQQQQQDENQFAQNPHNKNIPISSQNQAPITKNYRQYLLTIFEHYCRMSYATGNDPTFQQIQQKTQVMTINKFMIFCKQFGIVKLKGMSRNVLVEMFKKNAEFFKQMAYEQFLVVLGKIGNIVYGSGQQDEEAGEQEEGDINNKQQTKQFQQLLLFLQVNNFSAFKKKIQSLNIKFRPKVTKDTQPKKVVPSNYKFKFAPSSDGKTEQQIRQQLQQRKRIRSQNKLKILVQNKPKVASSKKDILKIQAQQRNINDRPQVRSSQPARKLAPPLPPARKISNSSSNNNNAVSQSVTGYANIHRLKLLGKQGQADSKLKLNSIVQQAKKIINYNLNKNNTQQYSQIPPSSSNRTSLHDRQTPYTNNYRNYTNADLQQYTDRDLAQSQQSNYSQRDLLSQYPANSGRKSYAPHGHSQLEKRTGAKGSKQVDELKGIIGDQDDDQDQYLEQHLNRQKKVGGGVNQRIQKKIKEIQMMNHESNSNMTKKVSTAKY